MPTHPMVIDRSTDHSPSRPASGVPTSPPMPEASRKIGTALASSPVTSVTVGAM